MKRRWTDEQLTEAVKSCQTMSDVLRHLGLSVSPGNFNSVNKHVARLSLSKSHFSGKAHGKSRPGRVETKDLLQKNSGIGSTKLKVRLLQEGLLKERCVRCGLGPLWQGERLCLQLDHINGDPTDNTLDNLRILCPNCHAQTSNFRGKNRASRYRAEIHTCPDCGSRRNRQAVACQPCHSARREQKTGWPPPEEVRDEVTRTSYMSVARKLGVSDNAVRKYLTRKSHSAGIKPTPLTAIA